MCMQFGPRWGKQTGESLPCGDVMFHVVPRVRNCEGAAANNPPPPPWEPLYI